MLFFIYYKLQKYEKYSYLSLFFLLCHFLLLILHAFLDMGELILGILCGIALSLFFSFGPAFFSQIRMSIQYGYRKSYPFAFGVSASDIIIVFLMLTVLKNVDLYELLHNVWVASIGGFVLVLMGFYYLKKEVKTYEDKQSKIKFKSIGGDPRRRTIFMQGFVINLANPLIWIYWVLHLLCRCAGLHAGAGHPEMQTGLDVAADYHSQAAEHHQQDLRCGDVRLCRLHRCVDGAIPSQPQSARARTAAGAPVVDTDD